MQLLVQYVVPAFQQGIEQFRVFWAEHAIALGSRHRFLDGTGKVTGVHQNVVPVFLDLRGRDFFTAAPRAHGWGVIEIEPLRTNDVSHG